MFEMVCGDQDRGMELGRHGMDQGTRFDRWSLGSVCDRAVIRRKLVAVAADTADGGFRRVLRELDQCISGVTVTGIRD